MKKLWLVLMSMIFVIAFTISAFAVDVKFSGEFYVAGMYQDKTSLVKDVGPSTAFYFQRLRLQTDFVVSPGLSLVTRADIMERAWGAARTSPGTALDTQSQGTVAENENIAFDYAYVQYVTPIGIFAAGYMPESSWGTVFGNSSTSVGKISYTFVSGGLVFIGQVAKHAESSKTAKNSSSTYTDADVDAYYLMLIYNFKYGAVGIANFYLDANVYRPYGYDQKVPLYLAPFANLKFGPVGIQAELLWQRGKQKYEIAGHDDVDINSLAGWLDVVGDFGMFYVGGTFAYVSGDDYSTTGKIEGGTLNGGNDFTPCLIMFNADRNYWAGSLAGYNSTSMSAPLNNAYFFQLRAGVRPLDKLDIKASIAYATADKTPAATWESRKYGYEVDLTATYKITNNLSYMLGLGYWKVGDYYYGTTSANRDLANEYMVINKLTLTF